MRESEEHNFYIPPAGNRLDCHNVAGHKKHTQKRKMLKGGTCKAKGKEIQKTTKNVTIIRRR